MNSRNVLGTVLIASTRRQTDARADIVAARRHSPRSAHVWGNGGQKRAGAIPENLHADANKRQLRELDDHSHPCPAEHTPQAIGKSVAKKNPGRKQKKLYNHLAR